MYPGVDASSSELQADDLDEISMVIRRLLMHLFVQTLARTVRYEDEIWLLESGRTQRLWKLVARKKDSLTDIDELYS